MAAKAAPLLALVLKAINVDCDWSARQTEDWCERCVCRVADQSDVEPSGNCVKRREKSVNNSIEVFVPYCWQNLEAYAVKLKLSGRYIVRATIDRNLMPTSYQSSRQMLCKRLKTTVACRNASCSQSSYAHDRIGSLVVPGGLTS